MPYFDYDGEINISVHDFLRSINQREKNELIQDLILDGDISNETLTAIRGISVPESEFENALNILHGKWCRLSKEDEEDIIRIAKKF
jgi:hypothetical protein